MRLCVCGPHTIYSLLVNSIQHTHLSCLINVFKNTGVKHMSDECPVKEGDVFNETDDDVVQRVLSVHPDRNPPVVMCRTIKRESESEETDEEYALEYVDQCVEKRKEFVKRGYDQLNVYEVYKMSVKELQNVLRLGKQNATGTKDEMRRRLCFFLRIADVPSDVSSGSDTEEAAAAAVAEPESDHDSLPDLEEEDIPICTPNTTMSESKKSDSALIVPGFSASKLDALSSCPKLERRALSSITKWVTWMAESSALARIPIFEPLAAPLCISVNMVRINARMQGKKPGPLRRYAG